MDYKGYTAWCPSQDELAKFYGEGFYPNFEVLNNNEYLIIEDENEETIDYYLKHNGKLEKVKRFWWQSYPKKCSIVLCLGFSKKKRYTD